MSGRRIKLLGFSLFTAAVIGLIFHSRSRVFSMAPTFGFLPSGWGVPHVHPSEVVSDQDLYVPIHEMTNILQTTLVAGSAGFNYFNNLYLFNGTFIFVSDDPVAAGFPEHGARYILTDVSKGKVNGPTGDDVFRVVGTDEARTLLGKIAVRQCGVSLFFNDTDGPEGSKIGAFLRHYYHFGEMFLGLWRLVVSAGDFELPTRLMYRGNEWRDGARITPWFQSTVLSGTLIEERDAWNDRRETKMTYLFDKIGIADRWAAHNFGPEASLWNKVTGDLPTALPVPLNWLEPMRDRIVLLSESAGCTAEREHATVPVVTYIDRQKTGRRLVDEDHQLLLASLQHLEEEGHIEFNHAQMETLDRIEQFCLAARTDIMVGVHGNGLSHQLWMRPGSGLIEIMKSGGFTRDYAILAEMASHEYYAIHNDTYLPREQWILDDGRSYPQNHGFHSPTINAHGPYVAALVKDMAVRRRHGPTPVDW